MLVVCWTGLEMSAFAIANNNEVKNSSSDDDHSTDAGSAQVLFAEKNAA